MKNTPCPFCGTDQRAQFCCVASHRLLDKDKLLGKKGGVCVAVVECMGCANINNIDVLVSVDFLVSAISLDRWIAPSDILDEILSCFD